MRSDSSGGVAVGTARNWLDDYPADAGAGDLFRGADAAVAEKWRAMAQALAGMADGDPVSLQDQVSRQISDLGLTYLLTGDEVERNWPLTPMPLVIGAHEWDTVERGLIQRAELMERLAADVYGPQRLVTQGHLPAAVIAGSPYFARKMLHQGPVSGHYLHVYAADLARGPGGEWRVLQDRVRFTTGIGYALENRVALSRATDGLLRRFHVRALADFFAGMREGIARDCTRERPRIALLTPGRFNQTYPEQAHLARYLGLPLVEGRDLTVTNGRLYVRTIAGPKRVDAVWRWMNTNSLDPLAFDARSELGVPKLFDAWAGGGLEIVNWPGVEVLESSAFSAFMPRLCRALLGEEPQLPTVATWWCGQAAEAQTVRDRLDELALVPAFGRQVEGIAAEGQIAGAGLAGAEKDALLEAMGRRPMDYCGQQIVHLSTAPAMIDGKLVPRPFTVRAFVARMGDGSWRVMPGGFARLSSTDQLPTSLMGEGDLSADLCIVDAEQPSRAPASLIADVPQVVRGGGILSSQAADNLFWFGRYTERAEATVRVIRSILGGSIDADSPWLYDEGVRRSLVGLLVKWQAIAANTSDRSLTAISGGALAEHEQAGGVGTLLERAGQIALSLRERFAPDFWRILNQPVPAFNPHRTQSLMAGINQLVERFSALAGLTAQNMVRGPAWRFMDIGRRLERSLTICAYVDQLSLAPLEADGLSMLLDLCDSQIVYRSRYLSGPVQAPVMDLILLDPDNPRSLAYQVAELTGHLEDLPSLRGDSLPEEPLRQSRAILGTLQAAAAEAVTPAWLSGVAANLVSLSDAISERYFLQFERPGADQERSLLG